MTTIEKMMSDRLQKCSFLPGSWEKKFVNQLSKWEDRQMTSKGRASLIRCFAKYHNQISDFESVCSFLTQQTILYDFNHLQR